MKWKRKASGTAGRRGLWIIWSSKLEVLLSCSSLGCGESWQPMAEAQSYLRRHDYYSGWRIG